MSYVDSSVGSSPLASAPGPGAMLEDEDPAAPGADLAPGAEDEPPAREPMAKDPPKGSLADQLKEQVDDVNLARYIDQQELDRIGQEAVRGYDIDELSRADWKDKAEAAMKFATQKPGEKQFPWPKASNVIFPLIGQACLEFHSRAYPAIVQGASVVKGKVWGSDKGTTVKDDQTGQPKVNQTPNGPQPVWLVEPGEKRQRADRIADHMSYQLLCEMPEWEPQTDQMLLQMPASGGFVRKTYFDPVAGCNRSLAVSLMNLVWNYHAPSFEAAPRHTEKLLVYPHEIAENERAEAEGEEPGMWLHYEYGVSSGTGGEGFGYDREADASDQSDEHAPHLFIEQHCRLDLDGDGYDEPYIVTVHHRSAHVVRIVAGYDAEGIQASSDGQTIQKVDPCRIYTLYPFLPNMDGGSYPVGFGHMLKPLNEAINTTINQMLDAGTLQNAGGGFVSDQLNIPSGQTLFQVGKYHRVNTKGAAIRDSVFPLPFQGPSSTLFQLLGVLLEAGKGLASIQSVLTGDAAIANAPPTTVLALIEQGMQVYTAIWKRIWRAEGAELAKLYALNRKRLTETSRYRQGDEWLEVTPEDYRLGGGVEPIADPTMVTNMQKLGRASVLMSFNGDPLINQVEIRRRYLEAANIDRIDDLMAPPDPQQQQMAMMAQQLEIQRAQAELGRTRAAELKDHTQAFLNMALARKNATAQEEAFIEQQLSYLRLHIEAVNATTKAAAVDHAFHATNSRAELAHADRETHAQLDHHNRMSRERVAALGADGGDPDTFPVPPGEMPGMPGPAVNRPAPGGVPSDMGGPVNPRAAFSGDNSSSGGQ